MAFQTEAANDADFRRCVSFDRPGAELNRRVKFYLTHEFRLAVQESLLWVWHQPPFLPKEYDALSLLLWLRILLLLRLLRSFSDVFRKRSMVKVASWRGHSWPPRDHQAAFERCRLPSALVRRGPARQIPFRSRVHGDTPRQTHRFRCV